MSQRFLTAVGSTVSPYDVMRLAWQDRVLKMLLSYDLISAEYATKIRKRYPKGFMLNGKIRDGWDRHKVIAHLAEYITAKQYCFTV